MGSSGGLQAFLPSAFVAGMSKQDSIMPIVPQPEGWYEGFRNASEDAKSAADWKTQTVVCHFPNLALALAW
jgi:hypothetical protein